MKLYFLDGGKEYRAVMDGEPLVPQTEWILSQVANPEHESTIAETFSLIVERERFRKHLADQWNATEIFTTTGRPVDAILSPVAATLAAPHDTTRWWGYSSYWNLADYSAVTFPVGVLHAENVSDETRSLPKQSRNPVEEAVHSQWKSETYDNAPISLQLVGRRLNEEKVLHSLSIVENALKR